jgi:hypothetical protein
MSALFWFLVLVLVGVTSQYIGVTSLYDFVRINTKTVNRFREFCFGVATACILLALGAAFGFLNISEGGLIWLIIVGGMSIPELAIGIYFYANANDLVEKLNIENWRGYGWIIMNFLGFVAAVLTVVHVWFSYS